MEPALSSLAAPRVFITTTSAAAGDGRVDNSRFSVIVLNYVLNQVVCKISLKI